MLLFFMNKRRENMETTVEGAYVDGTTLIFIDGAMVTGTTLILEG